MRVGIALQFQNTRDTDRYFAIQRGEEVGPAAKSDAEIFREQLALGDLVEPLGYDSLWTFEHHASPYMMLPNPQQFAAYFAGRTSRLNFGSMVTVLPWHNPVRLAENLALLQHQMGPNRTFTLGTGRGLSWREFDQMSISMDEARGRYEESLKILRLAFTQERFSFKGEYYTVENAMIRPRPLDPSVVLDAYGVWTSDDSMAIAARNGLNPVTIPSKALVDYAAQMDKYDEWRAEAGFGPAKRPIVQLFLMCHQDSDTAHELAQKHFTEYTESATWHYDFGGERLNSQAGYESYNTAGTSSYLSGGQKKAAAGLSEILLGEGLIGPPEECLERLKRVVDMMNPAEVVLVSASGSIDPELAKNSITLFSEALPEIKRWSSESVGAAAD